MRYWLIGLLLLAAPCWAGNVVTSFNTGAAPPSNPTLSSAALGTDGQTLTMTFSEALTQGTGYLDSLFNVDASTTGNDIAVTYSSGNTTDTHVYTLASTVNSGETVDLDFAGATDALEDSGGDDLQAFTSASVTNNSTQGGGGISDDFSSDTSANYTAIVNGISIAADVAGGSTNWADNSVYHSTTTGSNNHSVSADIQVSTSSTAANNAGLVFRCNGAGASSTGYRAGLVDTDRLYFYSFSGATNTFIAYWAISSDLVSGETYNVQVSMSGSTATAYIDLNSDGDFLDVNESLGDQTDSTYGTGAYIGLYFGRAGGVDFKADNLAGGAL